MRYLIVEVYEHRRWNDAENEEPGPVLVVDGVVGIAAEIGHADLHIGEGGVSSLWYQD